MLSTHKKLVATLVFVLSLTICTAVDAYDARPTDLEWVYPQTLEEDTEFRFLWTFHLSPNGYPSASQYNWRLYLSMDTTLSNSDHLLATYIVNVPAGADTRTFQVTVTPNPQGPGLSLPASGTYYVFLEISPGAGAPSDTNLANNITMGPNPIQVGGALPPPPPPPPPPPAAGTITAATVVTVPATGQSIVVAGYDDGNLEFRNWQGDILATRDVLGAVTALEAGILGSPPAARVFVASEDSSGALRVISPGDISTDIASRPSIGIIKAIAVCHEDSDAIYIGTAKAGGTLNKLNSLTLADEAVRSAMGQITQIAQIHGASSDLLGVGSDKSGGSVYFVDKDTLADVLPPRQNLGTIYGLSSADVDLDGEAELIIASSKNGGTVRLVEGPTFKSDLAVQDQLGKILALDYGRMQPESFIGPTNDAWILIASSSNSSTLRILKVDVGVSTVTFTDWATRNTAGTIPYAQLRDYYMVGVPLAGVVLADSDNVVLQVLDASLAGPFPSVPSGEDFESGDFSKFPWEHPGGKDWTVTSQQKHAGSYSAKAGSIGDSESSVLQVTLDCVSGDITFYAKASCESYYDGLRFYIDGSEKGQWSGAQDWTEVSFPVAAGQRTFKWVYSKDSSVSELSDSAWIDDIEFPVAAALMQSQPSGSPESSDQTVLRIETSVESWQSP
ncbi:MAG: hypothetical protein ABIF19_06415 [Planctomycetota bacterium]